MRAVRPTVPGKMNHNSCLSRDGSVIRVELRPKQPKRISGHSRIAVISPQRRKSARFRGPGKEMSCSLEKRSGKSKHVINHSRRKERTDRSGLTRFSSRGGGRGTAKTSPLTQPVAGQRPEDRCPDPDAVGIGKRPSPFTGVHSVFPFDAPSKNES